VDLTQLIVERILIAGAISIVSKVVSDKLLSWWQQRKEQVEKAVPAGQDPSPQQITKANEALVGVADQVEAELAKVTAPPGPDEIREAQRQIEAILVAHNFDDAHSARVAQKVAQAFAARIGQASEAAPVSGPADGGSQPRGAAQSNPENPR